MDSTLFTLPSLPDLPQVPQVPSGSFGYPTVADTNQYGFAVPVTATPVSTPSSIASKIMGKVTGSSSLGFHLPSLEDSVVIIVGIILIAAGLFAFKTTQTVIESAGKAAAKAGEFTA